MVVLGYSVKETFDVGPVFCLCRAVRSSDARSVLLKTLSTASLNVPVFRGLEQEFEITRHLELDGMLRPLEFFPGVEGGVLVFDDPGGYPLSHLLCKGALSLKFSLQIAIQVATTLARLHKQGVFHQNVQPANLLVHEESGRTLISGLCDATRILSTVEGGRVAKGGQLTPEYMSPEQTRRINRLVDYRTDFYSFGITLFEMLTGKLPFQAEGMLGWSHVHIAAQPPSLRDIDPEIPAVVSEIVLKLMAKSAEDRYQSGEGLVHDLNRCFCELESTDKISYFKVGLKDKPSRFEMTQRLYGRENELTNLMGLLDSSSRGASQVIFVTGPSGVGKTALVQAFRQAVLMKGGCFAASKSDSLRKKQPYGAILNACRDLVRQILAEDSKSIAEYRQQLDHSLGQNLGIITKCIPELDGILEAGSPPAVMGAIESRNRFQLCLRQFLQVFARTGHPLVLFLDDLQWADLPSLEMIESLSGQGVENSFLIGAYRSDVVNDSSSVSLAIRRIKAMGNVTGILSLAPLSLSVTEQVLTDSLQPTVKDIEALARLVYRKCAGNPLHMGALLSNLFNNHILTFDPETGWGWELSEVSKIEASENVIALANEKLKPLAPITRWVIAIAAMLGDPIVPEDLAIVCNLEVREVNDHLIKACQKGILVRTEQGFEFEHDQLKETAFAQIPVDRRAVTHLRVGRLLANREAQNPERIFDIADHMNMAISLLRTPLERSESALLNLKAGRNARAASGFHASFQYFMTGLSLLEETAWQDQYELCHALHTEAAEAAFLSGHFDEEDRLGNLVQAHARELLDFIPVLEIRIASMHARGQEREALAKSISVLEMLGIKVPARPTADDVKIAALQLREDVDAIFPELSDGFRPMTDPKKLAAMRLLITTSITAGFVDENLYLLIIGQSVNLTKQYGFCSESAVALVLAGGLFCLLYDDYEFGHQLASLGFELGKKMPANPWEPYAKFILANDVESFLVPPRELSCLYEEAHVASLARGDFVLACICAYFHAEAAFHSGMMLDHLNGLIEKHLEESHRLGIQRIQFGLGILQSLIQKLMIGSEKQAVANEATIDVDRARQFWHANADETVRFISLCHDMKIALIARDHHSIQEALAQAERLTVSGLKGIIPFEFYLCLCLLDGSSSLAEDECERRLDIVKGQTEGLQKRAAASPMSYQHKLDLVEALRLRVLGHTAEAIVFFNRAIEGARKYGYFHEEGLASELTAEFYLELGQLGIADMFYRRAASAYGCWGAHGAVDRLYRNHPEVFAQSFLSVPAHVAVITGGGSEGDSCENLDLGSIESAGQALAGELDLVTLIKKLMKILLQNAGAQRAALLIKHSGEIFVEAVGSIDQGVEFLQDVMLKERTDLCKGIIRYVTRTLDPVVLGNALVDSKFGNDPYVQKAKAKSIFCGPIMHQGKPVAFIYLENNRIHNLFFGERLTVVKMISSEAAIALENAKLTKNLKQEIEVRQHREEDLRHALEELSRIKENLEADNVYLREEIKSSHNFEEIVGESVALKNVLHKVELVAPTNASVLILGETGTGKELIARAIHSRSMRKDRSIVKVNCAALPSTLIESELFGHEKGAFTGALDKKVGRFELANGGTIFLDEIGDMPLDLQAKLLRVLQEGEFERLGSSKTLKVDVRVIAATNRDLQAEVDEGSFRKDLFYRLSVFPIQLPPLRERLGDVKLLVQHFIAKYEKQLGKRIAKVPVETITALTNYSWPGNIREMQNIIERAMILSPGDTLLIDNLFGEVAAHKLAASTGESLEDAERTHILKILEKCSWKIQGPGNAADQLGLHHSTLRFRMKKLGIKRPSND